MPYININGMLVCRIPADDVLNVENIDNIVHHTANTMRNRTIEQIRCDTIQGKKAEYALENYLRNNSSIKYVSYDEIRTDNYLSHAPFDGLLFKNNLSPAILQQFITLINNEIMIQLNTGIMYGRISASLREQMAENGIFTLEIKSSNLKRRNNRNNDYNGVPILYNSSQRTDDQRLILVQNILKNWDFFIFPHYLRRVQPENDIQTFSEYVEWVRNNRREFAGFNNDTQIIDSLIKEEYNNASDIYTRVYFDNEANEIYITGYILKKDFFSHIPTITRMKGYISGDTLYFTRSIQHYGKSFTLIENDDSIWNYNANAVRLNLYPNNQTFCCPRCGSVIVRNQFNGWSCSHSCGMVIDFLYGTRLSGDEVNTLLSGKRCISEINHANTVIFPDVVLNEYNGRIGYKWKCERLR